MYKKNILRHLTEGSFVKNFGYIFTSKFITSALSFLLKIYIVRLFSKEEFGIISVLLSLYSYFVFLSDMSVYQITQKEIISDKENYHDHYNLFANSKIFTISISVVLFLLTAAALGYEKYSDYILVLSICLIFEAAYKIPEIILLSFDEYKLYSKLVFSASIFMLAVQGVLVFAFKNVLVYFLSMLIYLTFCMILYYYIIGRRYSSIYVFKRVKFALVWNLLKKALSIGLGSFLYLIFYRIDVLFIEKFLGIVPAGEYNLSFTILDQFIYLILSQFLIVLYPKMIKYYNEDKERLRKTLLLISGVFFAAFILLFVASYFFSDYVITLLFGSRYLNSARLLTFMIPNLFLISIYSISMRCMVIFSKERRYFFTMAAAVLIKTALSFYFIGKIGIMGIIISTFITFIIINVSFYLALNKEYASAN